MSSRVGKIEEKSNAILTEQKVLSSNLDRDFTASRNQQLDSSNAPLTTEGIFSPWSWFSVNATILLIA